MTTGKPGPLLIIQYFLGVTKEYRKVHFLFYEWYLYVGCEVHIKL
jgi:hypothetical protein